MVFSWKWMVTLISLWWRGGGGGDSNEGEGAPQLPQALGCQHPCDTLTCHWQREVLTQPPPPLPSAQLWGGPSTRQYLWNLSVRFL